MTLHNDSGVAIATASVAVDDDVRTFSMIPPGESRFASFRIPADSIYDVHAKLADGAELQVRDGYLTNGITSSDLIIVQRGRIEIVMGYR